MDEHVRRAAPEAPVEPVPMTSAADAESRAQTEAGLGVPLEEVEAWVASWDTPGELPMPVARPLR